MLQTLTVDFNPRPPRGGRPITQSIPEPSRTFQSTPPARGATKGRFTSTGDTEVISIHAPREGGDQRIYHGQYRGGIFQSTPPARGATFAGRADEPPEPFQSTPPARGATMDKELFVQNIKISIHAPREGGDSKDAQFYLRIFDKQVELLRFLGKIRGGCLRNPEKDRRFLGKSLANLPEISGHLDFAGGGKARPGYPCAVPPPRRAACVRGSEDPPADRCSSYRNAPLFSHIASPDSKSADCLSQDP